MAVFAVNRAQRQLVELYRPEIEQKFRVGVQLSTYADPTADEGGNSGGRIAPVHGGGLLDMSDGGQILQESQQMWVEIAGDSSVAVKAKVRSYITKWITFRMAPPLFHSFLQKGIYQSGK